VVRASQFTDRVEHGNPGGDATALAAAGKAIYWMDVGNEGDPAQITLVWKHDGVEVARQTLNVGHAPHWRTWGSHPRGTAHVIEVTVLEADGGILKTDSATIGAP
jgi:hypothetical protein